jgi:N-acetylmuramate 1-kinase
VLILHARGKAAAERRHLPLSTPFGDRLYRWEHALFCDEFLEKHRRLDRLRTAAIRAELAVLIPPLKRAAKVLVHRDLQSSNILLRRGEPVFIDFQGMRLGPATYDLASLLCDPYVELPTAEVECLLDYYVARTPEGEAVRRVFWTAAVQRLAQALGAYGRLGAHPATAWFLHYVPPALCALRVALAHLDGFQELRQTVHELGEEPEREVRP